MAAFPITGRYVGDFVPHLVAVDTDDTMDEVAEKVAVHTLGRRLPRPVPDPGYDVLLHGEVVPADTTLGEVMATTPLLPLQWIDVRSRASS